MPMRLSGLMSGMDTESIVAQLVEAKKTKVTKAVKAQKSLKYKQDAWKALNTQIMGVYNKHLSKMRFESAYMKKTTKVSNSSIVSVITGENAMNGVQNMEVKQLARQAFLTGGQLPETVTVKDENGKDQEVSVTGKTTLGELGFTGSASIKVVTADKTTELTLDANSTINAFVNSLRQAGLSANYDEANRRFFVTSKASGTKSDFAIAASNEDGLKALTTLGLSYDNQEVRDSYAQLFGAKSLPADKDVFAKFADKFDDATLENLSEADRKLFAAYKADPSKGFEYDKLSEEGKALYKEKYYDYLLSADVLKDTIQTKQKERLDSLTERWNNLQTEKTKLENTNSELVTKITGNQAIMDSLRAKWAEYNLDGDMSIEDGLAGKLTGAKKETFEIYLGEAFDAAKAAGTLTEDDVKALETLEADWKKNVSALANNSTSIESMKTNSVEIAGDGTVSLREEVANSIANEVNTAVSLYKNLEQAAKNTGAGKTAGRDAEITLNGVSYTSSKNTFEVNGLTLTVNATTAPGEEVTITTQDDTDGIYDMIKDFLKDYNALINQMDKLYNADSAKGYEPLTDEEKEAMSDSQIEEWETKIKDSILRKDSSLNSISTLMKRIMMEGVEVNGQQMYLSNFGIGTLSYFTAAENERNAYHIDGDSDDEHTSGNADKLKSMIANDPDTVIAFFSKLSENLRSEMFEAMKDTDYSSSFSAYEDKKMKTDYDDYTTKIKELEKKLADYEDKWYAKFAAMETALAKMQNNASAVTSLLGG